MTQPASAATHSVTHSEPPDAHPSGYKWVERNWAVVGVSATDAWYSAGNGNSGVSGSSHCTPLTSPPPLGLEHMSLISCISQYNSVCSEMNCSLASIPLDSPPRMMGNRVSRGSSHVATNPSK